ncbi:uncharacterized protein [Epargyreus clarus]|uniref:uncharacterized protein n=1 Tax=Epargyreus clarus TaxID=520877 RepID=UPI003C2E763D
MDIRACMRGFSYMPKNTMEVIDLKYVEKDALEQTWRTSRRERLKQQEQKIWDEFVQERDVVSSVCEDDPYQFLHQLPEDCIKELLEVELGKMKKEQIIEEIQEQEEQPEETPIVDFDNQHVVTVVEEDKDDIFHIFDDEKDEDVSGPEEEALNDSAGSPPCTVRERHWEREKLSPSKSLSPDKASSKSSENVTSMIENSIYCAKVKDLRMKINMELLDIIATLDRQDLTKIEPEEVPKLLKRSSEFCARFNRIYLYQLQRQIHDVQRNNAAALPLARHTARQAQLLRAASLHHNLLQAAQIFHKSIAQTACVRECGGSLRALLGAAAAAGAACRAAAPAAPPAAAALYTDDIQNSCDKLEEALNEYTEKLSEYLDNLGQIGKSRKGRYKGKRRSLKSWSKSGTKSGTDTDGRLSMYSLDTLRLNLNSKSSISKDHSSGTSKVRGGITSRRNKKTDKDESPKSPKKSPRGRRPLMRDPAAGRPRRARAHDLDVPTLVEAVAPCASSHISREDTPRGSKEATPRHKDPRKTHNHTPRRKVFRSPKSAKKYNSPNKYSEDIPKLPVDNEVKCVENVDTPKTEHDIKIEIKPKSPERIIEESPRLQKYESPEELKRIRDGPKSPTKTKYETINVKVNYQENLLKMDRELSSPKHKQDGHTDGRKSDRDRNKASEVTPTSCEVSRLLRQLCGGDALGGRHERVSGTKNAQLLCVSSGSPRQPSTPQLLRILEETIQKKAPKPLFPKTNVSVRGAERLRLNFNIPESTVQSHFQYRTKFVQHMLTSSMYANSAVGKPWEMIGSVSDQIIDELLLSCAREMELREVVRELYRCETQ